MFLYTKSNGLSADVSLFFRFMSLNICASRSESFRAVSAPETECYVSQI